MRDVIAVTVIARRSEATTKQSPTRWRRLLRHFVARNDGGMAVAKSVEKVAIPWRKFNANYANRRMTRMKPIKNSCNSLIRGIRV